MGGWADGQMDGCVLGVKAVLRIAYSNKNVGKHWSTAYYYF